MYVEVWKCGHGVRACLNMWVGAIGSNRLLRVTLERRESDSDVDLMGSVGHELQHVVEALSESNVTNGRKLYDFFTRLAPADGTRRFETRAAIHAGDDTHVSGWWRCGGE